MRGCGDSDEPDFSFRARFPWEHDPEFPGNGVWDVPLFSFRPRGCHYLEFESRWGTPFRFVRFR